MSENESSKGKSLFSVASIALVLVIIGCLGYLAHFLINKKIPDTKVTQKKECKTQHKEHVVPDDLMKGILTKGQKVSVTIGDFACLSIQKDSVVLFQFSDQIPPVFRKVVGMPGDRYRIDLKPKTKDEWRLKINRKQVTIGNSSPFKKSTQPPVLKTYAESRNGVLIPGEYILFSNVVPSLSDSSNFGVIKGEQIIGIIEKN